MAQMQKAIPRVEVETEALTRTQRKTSDRTTGLLPPSCQGPDGKFRHMPEEELRPYVESVRRRFAEIAQIPADPSDPADEEWMRGIDQMRPHRPLFKGCYWVVGVRLA
jgi:hypothetical protein